MIADLGSAAGPEKLVGRVAASRYIRSLYLLCRAFFTVTSEPMVCVGCASVVATDNHEAGPHLRVLRSCAPRTLTECFSCSHHKYMSSRAPQQ